jgi:N-acetylmuramoyl-L-alanine amidase
MGCEPMVVRTAGLAFLGMLFASAAAAVDRPPAPPAADSATAAAQTQFPGRNSTQDPAQLPAQAPAPVPIQVVPAATDFRLAGDEAQTRFVMDISRKIDLHAFALADPYRVVIDMPEVAFHLPPKAGDSGKGLIKAFRFGLMMPGGSRMVFDLAKPARVERVYAMEAADGAPARLVLELAATDRETFLRHITLDNKLGHADTPARTLPEAASSDPRPLVVLDPGHGGLDTGTKSPSGSPTRKIAPTSSPAST